MSSLSNGPVTDVTPPDRVESPKKICNTVPVSRTIQNVQTPHDPSHALQDRWRVLLGLEPDINLMHSGFTPRYTGWGRWQYEHKFWTERTKAYHDLQQRVAALRLAVADVLRIDLQHLYLDVPICNYRDIGRDAKIVLHLPNHFLGAKYEQDQLSDLVTKRLGGSWTASWKLNAHPQQVTFTRSTVKPKPPKKVDWELSPDKYSIFIGRTGDGPKYVKVETETPHWAVAANTGGGKTTTLHIPIVHWRSHGALVDIIDLKEDSFDASLEGVSGVRIHRTARSAVMAMAEFYTSIKSKRHAVQNGYPADEIPDRILVMDEFGSFVATSEMWYKFGLEQPGKPPFKSWFHMILMQGRTKEHRMVLGTHDFSINTFGSTSVRDLFGTKIVIGDVSYPMWVTTFGYQAPKITVDKSIPGRASIGTAGTNPEELQIAYLSQSDVRMLCEDLPPAPSWFDSGQLAPWISEETIQLADEEATVRAFLPGGELMQGITVLGSQADCYTPGQRKPAETGTPVSSGRPVLHVVRDPEEESRIAAAQLVGLREALEKGHLADLVEEAQSRQPGADFTRCVDLALQVVRKARKGDVNFPQSVGKRGQELLYQVGQLQTWSASRPGKIAGDQRKDA